MDAGNTRQLKSVANVNLRVLSKSLGSVVVVAFSINPNVEVPLAQLKEKRRKFSVRERQDILKCAQNTSVKETITSLKRKQGFERVNKAYLDRWQTSKAAKKLGRPHDDRFRMSAVLDWLLVQKEPEFLNNPIVAKPKFSPSWIQTFLETSYLVLVQQRMEEIQRETVKGRYTKEEVINADEIGVFYVRRRIEDEMGKGFIIIKSNASKRDLSTTRVIQNLHALPGFTALDGWTLKLWKRTLSCINKREKQSLRGTSVFSSSTLTEGTSITCQRKAWMD
ncbi:MAG: hypothetical protein SGPRY_004211, partial [Prymnesium sp.]